MIKSCGECRVRYCGANCTYQASEINKLLDIIKKLKFVKNPAVRMIEVTDSTLVESFGYDNTKSDLYLKFVNGTEYVYIGVPAYEFTKMVNAQSRGKFYNDNIKGRFDVVRIDN